MITDRQAQASEHFIEQMGLIAQAEGSPRIAGRILGLLLIEGRPLALHDIAERLHISKASASTNARLLASRDLIRRTAHAGDRQDYYETIAGSEAQALTAIAERLRRNARLIGECADGVAAESEAAGARVRRLAEFYQRSAGFVTEWSDRLTRDA